MKKQLQVRPAVADERGSLESLQLRASLANAGDRDALLANPDAIELPDAQISAGLVFVAEQNANILGFASLLPRHDSETELDGLFVEPVAWRLGIGRLLVDHCCEIARAKGSTSLHVVGNPHAAAFYNACGFKQFGFHATRFGVGLLMKKLL